MKNAISSRLQDVKAYKQHKEVESNIRKSIDYAFDASEGLPIHASAVRTAKGALVFLGYSTSGKSTISDMLSSTFPKLEDDLVFLVKNTGVWCVRSGNVPENKQRFFPLLGFVGITKAESVSIKELGSKELCRKLIDAYFEVDHHRHVVNQEYNRNVFFQISKMAKINSGWQLSFALESNVSQFISRYFDLTISSGGGNGESRF